MQTSNQGAAAPARPGRYRVHLQSAPGHWASYEGHVDVTVTIDPDSEATEAHQVFRAAVRQLARSSFPDRPSLSSWRLIAIETGLPGIGFGPRSCMEAGE